GAGRSRARSRKAARAARPGGAGDHGRGDHRRRGVARLPHADDRQGDARRSSSRHGGDCAGRRRRPRRRAERARGQGSAAHRSQRRRRRDHRAHARAGGGRRPRRRSARDAVRVRGVRRRGGRSRRHLGHRHDLPEGARGRKGGIGREERPGVQADHRQGQRGLLAARGGARRPHSDAGQGGSDRSVRVRGAGVILAVIVSLALQTTVARYVVRGTVTIDLVLVAIVYVALTEGPATGLLAGAFARLVQDALSSPVIGIGGLAKTIVGFVAGVIGTQFIVSQPLPRFVVFFGASVAHAAIFMGLYELLDLRHFGTPYGTIAAQSGVNAL